MGEKAKEAAQPYTGNGEENQVSPPLDDFQNKKKHRSK